MTFSGKTMTNEANDALPEVKELLSQYLHCEQQRADVLPLVAALLDWAARPAPAIDTSPKSTMPDPWKKKKPVKAESDISEDAILADVLTLAANAFQVPPNTPAEGQRIVQQAVGLAEKIRTASKRRNDSLQNIFHLLQDETAATEKLDTGIRQLQQERDAIQPEIERKQTERDTLRKQVDSQKTKRDAITQEIDILKSQEAAAKDKIEKLRAQEAATAQTKKELEELQVKCGEEQKLQSKLEEVKAKWRYTQPLIKDLQNNPLLDPAVSQKIQEIWRTLPADKLDEAVTATKS